MLLPSAPLKRKLISLSLGIDNFLFTELKKQLQNPVLGWGLWYHKTMSLSFIFHFTAQQSSSHMFILEDQGPKQLKVNLTLICVLLVSHLYSTNIPSKAPDISKWLLVLYLKHSYLIKIKLKVKKHSFWCSNSSLRIAFKIPIFAHRSSVGSCANSPLKVVAVYLEFRCLSLN